MKEKFIVEGANWEASIMVDTEIHEHPHMEAATQALENIFRDGPDSELSDEFNIKMTDDDPPALGLVVKCVKDGQQGNELEEMWMRSSALAENAGLLNLAKDMKQMENEITKRSQEE